jgi:thiol-disulfide isomerase/thioredoxin
MRAGCVRGLGVLLLAVPVLAAVFDAAHAAELKPWTGDPSAPAFTLRDMQGKDQRLADHKGKVVVLNFWATWCEPCREEMPAMQRLQDRLSGKPFIILAVDFGEGEPRIREFLQKVPVRFPILLDRDGSVAKAWRVKVLPISYVIDPEQKVRYSVVGDAQWDSPAVEKLMRSLLPPGK